MTSNAVSLAKSKYQPECIPLAIYADDIMVGFAMYCVDTDDGEYWIYRMMIYKKFQSKGYGTMALRHLTDRLLADRAHNKIMPGVHKESIAAVRLYEGFGFRFTGESWGEEYIMQYDF